MAHAYFFAGEAEEGIRHALAHAESLFGRSAQGHPDLMLLRYGLFSVDDARKIISFADQSPLLGEHKAIVMVASRVFHEAQNALLKLFEEPPAGTTLILIIPSEGMLLPTLRSRLTPLMARGAVRDEGERGMMGEGSREGEAFAIEFLALAKKDREKFITKLVDRSKSDKDEDKQAVRMEAVRLIDSLTRVAHAAWLKDSKEEYALLLYDLNRFAPIMHERSAPLKLIFEHLLLVMPASL